jgi:hypothetical protein
LQSQLQTSLEDVVATATSKLHHGFESQLNQMAFGVASTLPPTATLVLAGKTWTQPSLLQSLRSTQSLMEGLRDAKIQVARTRQVLEDDVPRAHALLTALSAALQGYFGKEHPQLANFGVPVGTRRPPSSDTLALAAAKARATRQLRHTLGSRQRLAIKSKGPVTVTLFGPDGRMVSSTDSNPLASATVARPGGIGPPVEKP